MPKSKRIDMTGQRYGRLVVVEFLQVDLKRRSIWSCLCDCGSVIATRRYSLISGLVKSCGHCPTNTIKKEKQHMVCSIGNRVEFIFDNTDIDFINSHVWYYNNRGYIYTRENGKNILLHRLILNAEEDQEVDHQNGDKLDNRRFNLRIVSSQENSFNQTLRSDNSTGWKGVSFSIRDRKYRANICKGGKNYSLGYYDTAIEAAMAYNKAAKRLFGEYACLNPIGDTVGYRTIKQSENITGKISNF